MIQEERLQELTECYLKSVIMKISSLDNADFESSISFGDMGFDSFGTIKIIKELESDFGILPKTLLFENFNIEALAKYLLTIMLM